MARQFLNGEITTTLTVSGLSILGGGQQVKARTIAASGSLTSADYVAYCNASGAITLTLPASAGNGQSFIIINVGANIVTIAPAGTDSIGTSASATSITIPQYGAVTLIDASVLGKWAQLLELPEIWNRFSLGTTGGAANTQTGSYPLGQIPTSYVSGMMAQFVAGFSNTAAITLNINALGVKNIYSAGSPCVGNEIVAGRTYIVVYDGSQFELINSSNTLATFGNVAPNLVLAGPASGASAIPTARTLVMADLPPTMGGAGSLVSIAAGVSTGSSSYGIACDPTGRYAYCVSRNANTVSMFSIGATGALTSIATAVATGVGPYFIACDPSGRFVYVTGGGANTVSMFAIGSTGALTSIGADVTTGVAPYGIACDPTGKYVYTANYTGASISMFSIGANGALTSIAAGVSTGSSSYGIACDPTGKYVYTANLGGSTVSMFSIGANGALTSIAAAVATGASARGIVCDPSGRYVYVACTNGSVISMFAIGASGALTSIAADFSTPSPFSIACDPSGRYVYATNQGTGMVYLFSIGSNGTLTTLAAAVFADSVSSSPVSIACDPSGRYVYTSDNGSAIISMFAIQNVDSIQSRPAARILSDRITPATPSKCMQIGSGPSNYTITSSNGTPSIIPGLLSTSSGLILISCSNGDQAIIGLGVGSTVGYCAITWNVSGASLAVTTPTTGKWAVDYVAGAGWRINNQVGASGDRLGYACLLLGGI